MSEYKRPAPGETLIYHTGILMADRQRKLHEKVISERCAQVDAAAMAAFEDYMNGRVTLVQRRVAPNVCEYLAIGVERRA